MCTMQSVKQTSNPQPPNMSDQGALNVVNGNPDDTVLGHVPQANVNILPDTDAVPHAV